MAIHEIILKIIVLIVKALLKIRMHFQAIIWHF